MTPKQLRILAQPELHHARMLLGFSGWMDGGEVSTGTIRRFAEILQAEKLAEIDPEDFYLYSVPGNMEVAAMFRPHTKIEDGLIVEYDPPESTFHFSRSAGLILFEGREPNLRWQEYGECILSLASTFGAEMIYFIGSVGGLVPHTREPRLFGSMSREDLRPLLAPYGVRFTNYEGPAGFVTYLTRQADERGIPLVSLVAEIPAYIQGPNPRCIESVIRRLAAILGLEVRLDELRKASDAFERRLAKVVRERTELAGLITKLEEDYDNEVFNTEMGDLKQWLQEKGIRLD